MKTKYLMLLPLALLVSCGKSGDPDNGKGQKEKKGPFDAVVGEALSDWAEGCLDIHAISTGRGECTFFILPDGTSMCVDAGEVETSTTSPVSVTQRPNASTRPYFTQARYMKHFLAATGHDYLDYMVMTHFHVDHFGTPTGKDFVKSSEGYCQTGIMAIFTTLPYKKLLDRAYSADDPDYRFMTESGQIYSASALPDYANFVRYATTKKGLQMERFKAGVDDQLVLNYGKEKYPSFRIFNYAVNGEYWNGKALVDAYGTAIPNENGNCTIFLLSYGKFDYYTAGDAGGNTKMAVPVAKSIGKKIEAMKADHHMSTQCVGDPLSGNSGEQMKVLQPLVIATQSFARRLDQPVIETVSALLDGRYYDEGRKPSLYFTNIDDVIYTPNQALYSQTHVNGHIVIRVLPGGDSFYVYQLDDTNNYYKVKSIEGPFLCE